MDEDGSGEVDFDEFKIWWESQKGKKSKWAAALNDRWEGALKIIQVSTAALGQRARPPALRSWQ